MGAQELEGQADAFRAKLDSPFALAGGQEHGVGILYRSDRWDLIETSTFDLNEKDQWGQRIVRWARLSHKASQKRLLVYNTHWCVCSGQLLESTAKTVASAIAARSPKGEPAVLMGDLNVFEGFEDSLAVRYLKGENGGPAALRDSYRVVHPAGFVSTFGAAGKIDYIFVTPGIQVVAAEVDATSISGGQGSDHHPVLADILL